MLTRRTVIRGMAASALAGAVVPMRAVLATVPSDKRLVVVILRGGLDGLHAAPPWSDKRYRQLRPNIALPAPGDDGGAIDLDGSFGLHPALAPFAELYRQKQFAIIPAVATGYRKRSHFDGQNVLENGTDRPFGANDGWLNRAMSALDADAGRRLGLAVGHAVPLILRGATRVRTWAPSVMPKVDDDLLNWLSANYAGDPLFKKAFEQARGSDVATLSSTGKTGLGAIRRPKFQHVAGPAGTLLAQANGARIAVLEIGGWDTHTNQANRLNRRLADLAAGARVLQNSLGAAWQKTAVVVISEFGRTVAENGSRGTDHGVGGVAFVFGGAIAGGRVLGRWPGLGGSALYEGRDVMPANDYRGIMKGLLSDHLGLTEALLEERIFPNSRSATPIEGLIRQV